MLSWIGGTDHDAANGKGDKQPGPIARMVDDKRFSDFTRIHLLNSYPNKSAANFKRWLGKRTKARITTQRIKLSSPTDFGEIYRVSSEVIEALLDEYGSDLTLTISASPGTYVMSAVWVILANTRFTVDLFEASPEAGVQEINLPFELYADFIPDLLSRADARRKQSVLGELPEAPGFEDIVHRCPAMVSAVQRARRIAPRNVSVLIEGESGTGKELFARAIHKGSARAMKPFITVNCGAIPSDRVEIDLFGQERGSASGRLSKGYFENAHSGTIFLDEVGELEPNIQVKLLRAFQEGEIVRVGGSRPISVKVRCVAATSRRLNEEVAAGRFRRDLFYRLAEDVVRLPPLRERDSDLALIMDVLLDEINNEMAFEPGFKRVRLTAGGRTALRAYHWPGNVREMRNILVRAAVHSQTNAIDKVEVEEALNIAPVRSEQQILDRPIAEGFDLDEPLNDVARHYIARALDQADHNVGRAARLLGFNNYQTLSNRMMKLGLK